MSHQGCSNSYPRTLTHALLIIPVLLLASCSLRFLYNQLDWLIPWYVDDYVTLSAQQETLLDNNLSRYLDWHRKDQLPHYAEFLDSVLVSFKQGLTQSDIRRFKNQSEQFVTLLLERMRPGVIELLHHMDDQQVDELFESLTQKNDEYRKKYIDVSEEKLRSKRSKNVQKFIKRWTGKLNKEQIELIDDWSLQFKLMGEEFLQSRISWQQDFRILLDKRNDRLILQQGLNKLFANGYASRSQPFQQKYDYNKKILLELYESLDRSLTEKQRQHVIKQLTKYAQDFRYLSSKE